MKSFVTAIALAFLAGCAMTSEEIRTTADPIQVSSDRSPEDAAKCVARHSEEDGGFAPRIERGSAGQWIATIIQPGFGPLAVVDTAPKGSGSTITFRFRGHLPAVQSRFVEPWTKGC